MICYSDRHDGSKEAIYLIAVNVINATIIKRSLRNLFAYMKVSLYVEI
jgi:hypothetical protein